MMTEFNCLRTKEDKSPAGWDALFAKDVVVLGANGRLEHHISYTDQDRSQIVTFVDKKKK